MPRALLLCLLIVMAALTACSKSHYSYPSYQPASPPYGKVLPLRVAILYPEEGRSAPNRDEDLEPIITSRCAETPTYISPRLDVSRSLLDELRATGAFKIVHWAPASSHDYDLLVQLKLLSGGKRFESPTCPTMLGPFIWDLQVKDRYGRVLERTRLTQAMIKVMAGSPAGEYRKDEALFLGQAAAIILRAAEGAITEDSDSLAVLAGDEVSELTALRARAAANPDDRELGIMYLARIGTLQAELLATDRGEEAIQQLYDQAWLDVQEELRKELRELGEHVRQLLMENLTLLLENMNSLQHFGGGQQILSPKLARAVDLAREQSYQEAGSNAGVQQLYNSLGKDLLPEGLEKLAAEAGVDEKLAAALRTALAPKAASSPTVAGGCGKDTDCKGERICVNHECVDPPR